MKCPKCKKKIDEVNVVSLCWQKGTLTGKTITDYGSIEEAYDTQRIECPECGKDIQDAVKEE